MKVEDLEAKAVTRISKDSILIHAGTDMRACNTFFGGATCATKLANMNLWCSPCRLRATLEAGVVTTETEEEEEEDDEEFEYDPQDDLDAALEHIMHLVDFIDYIIDTEKTVIEPPDRKEARAFIKDAQDFLDTFDFSEKKEKKEEPVVWEEVEEGKPLCGKIDEGLYCRYWAGSSCIEEDNDRENWCADCESYMLTKEADNPHVLKPGEVDLLNQMITNLKMARD